ncbi:MAG: electron transfer flavoprotein subunit beta/FixA family protein, partial [Candidatus Acidiferrales bacterium]
MKQVPAKDAPLRINEAQTWVREGDISYETCEPDNFALEAALQLKEKHGGEVVVLSLGPERVRQVIKEGLAKGAERAIHIQDDRFFALDPLQMAAAIAGAAREEKFDLILTGLQSDDHGYG